MEWHIRWHGCCVFCIRNSGSPVQHGHGPQGAPATVLLFHDLCVRSSASCRMIHLRPRHTKRTTMHTKFCCDLLTHYFCTHTTWVNTSGFAAQGARGFSHVAAETTKKCLLKNVAVPKLKNGMDYVQLGDSDLVVSKVCSTSECAFKIHVLTLLAIS